ncbi:hypothetical protein NDU88_001248 [Pleurodeles waltl]|uniref:Uncharacterized protein n=1 Tax=Pleurodeles waltl TaxID=8319 RepID=A0AAV7US93_PLEWA|nr:hypothetical protein NDU88_001248 [Pleurodeles waltl]
MEVPLLDRDEDAKEEPRWRPGRSLDPSAPFPATSRYPSRRPPSGLAETAGTAARLGKIGAPNARYERLPDLVRRVWDSSVRVGSSARRGELRLQPRLISPGAAAVYLPADPRLGEQGRRG